MLGTLLQGIEVSERAYAGGWFDWLSPFSVFCGLALVCAYILLGSCWLLIKLPEELMGGRYYVVARRWGTSDGSLYIHRQFVAAIEPKYRI